MFSYLAVGLTVISVVATWLVPTQAPYREADLLALVLAALAPMALLLPRLAADPPDVVAHDEPAPAPGSAWAGLRTAAPRLAATAVVAVIVVLNAAAGYQVGFIQWPPWIALFICFAMDGLWVRLAAGSIIVAAVIGYLAFDRGTLSDNPPVGIVMIAVIAAIAGDAARTRRAYAVAAHAEVLGRSREQALVAERLLLEERSRLARELHDSLGHSVNVMVLQAGVGRRVFAENPGFAQEALGSVVTVGRGALEELDRLLRVLHPLDPGRDEQPLAPTLADVLTLAERIRTAGREVDLHTGATEQLQLSSGGARALYRIVQEALTNAVRHSSSGRISVDINQRAGDVVVEVSNPLDPGPSAGAAARAARPVAGRGLINMRERARLEGGRFEAGPVDQDFRVRATLPTDVAEAVT